MPTTFSLEALRQQIISLPEKSKQAKRIESARQYLTKLRQHAEAVRVTRSGRLSAPLVFEDVSLAKVDDHLKAVARAARRLHKRLSEDGSRIAETKTSDTVADIGSSCQAAEKSLSSTWTDELAKVVNRYEKLIAALQRLRLGRAEELALALQRLKNNATRPPYQKDRATSLRTDVDSLANAITMLGLTGPLGTFLTRAAERTVGADPRDLFKPEVKEFFEKNDLWPMLVVTLKQ
jgi:hypothetical protein